MNMLVKSLVGIAVAFPSSGIAQETPVQDVVVATKKVEQSSSLTMASLPENTEVLLSLNNEISTKKNKEGETIHLSVKHDVTHEGYVVIPQGTRAVGEITWMTGKGMFGKSGKFELEIKYAELGGKRVPLNGKFRQEGAGNTVATVGAVVVVPVAGFFVTGRSGVMPRGKELTVFTQNKVPYAREAAAQKSEPIVAKPVSAAAGAATEPLEEQAEQGETPAE